MSASLQVCGKLNSMSQGAAHDMLDSRRLHVVDVASGHSYLIDTGADVCIVPPTFQERLKPCDEFRLYAANGTPIRTFGRLVITLDFGFKKRFRWCFIVAKVSKAIIGADFLAHYGLLVDIKNQRLFDPKSKSSLSANLVTSSFSPIKTFSARTNCAAASSYNKVFSI